MTETESRKRTEMARDLGRYDSHYSDVYRRLNLLYDRITEVGSESLRIYADGIMLAPIATPDEMKRGAS